MLWWLHSFRANILFLSWIKYVNLIVSQNMPFWALLMLLLQDNIHLWLICKSSVKIVIFKDTQKNDPLVYIGKRIKNIEVSEEEKEYWHPPSPQMYLFMIFSMSFVEIIPLLLWCTYHSISVLDVVVLSGYGIFLKHSYLFCHRKEFRKKCDVMCVILCAFVIDKIIATTACGGGTTLIAQNG